MAALLNLLIPQTEKAQKQPKVWVGDGLPAIPKKLHASILNWEFVELAELNPPSCTETLGSDPDSQKLIITPSFQLSRFKRKPIRDISTWSQCFAVYSAVLATKESNIMPELTRTLPPPLPPPHIHTHQPRLTLAWNPCFLCVLPGFLCVCLLTPEVHTPTQGSGH